MDEAKVGGAIVALVLFILAILCFYVTSKLAGLGLFSLSLATIISTHIKTDD